MGRTAGGSGTGGRSRAGRKPVAGGRAGLPPGEAAALRSALLQAEERLAALGADASAAARRRLEQRIALLRASQVPAPGVAPLEPEVALLTVSRFFDAAWYVAAYPDVAAAGIDPIRHYLQHGAREGRDPGPLFDTDWYAARVPDLAGSGVNPLVHFLRHGLREGRLPAAPAIVFAGADHPLRHHRLAEFAPSEDRLRLFLGYEFGEPAADAVRTIVARLGIDGAGRAAPGNADLADVVADLARLPAAADIRPAEVSVIVPVHNQIRHTLACVASLLFFGIGRPFEILVGDDGSTDGTAELLAGALPCLRVIRSETPLGFLRNVNTVAAEAAGSVLVLLNNDTVVLPGAIDALVATLAADASVGIAGARLVYPDGVLQEAGAFIFADGNAWNHGRGGDPLDPLYGYLRRTDYCSAAAVAVPTQLWRNLGGFDERYVPAYYEDTDLAMRVRKAGRTVVYQPRAVVIHFEGVSHGVAVAGSGIKKHQALNRETFRRRWRRELPAFGPCDPDRLPAHRDSRGTVLYVDAETPRPDTDSGSIDAFETLKLLVGAGYRVVFAPQNMARPEPYSSALNRIGVETLFHPYCTTLAGAVGALAGAVDVAILSRVTVAAEVFDEIRAAMPETAVIFNTVDLHYLRMEREAALSKDRSAWIRATATRGAELDLVRRADATIVLSAYEEELLGRIVPGANVACIPPPRPRPARIDRPFAERRGILFLGGFRHQPNVDAVLWFVAEILPILRDQGCAEPFIVAGSNMPPQIESLHGNGIEIRGFVEDLPALMAECRLMVAPLRYGAGIKGKVISSLAHGLPVVATGVAVEGSGLEPGRDLLAADAPAEIAGAIVRLSGDARLWRRLASAGIAAFDANFAAEKVGARIVDLVEDARRRRASARK